MIVVAKISPMPGTVFSRRYSERNFTRSWSRRSSISIRSCSTWLTARLHSTASVTSGMNPSALTCLAVSCLIAKLFMRPPVCRATMFSIESICAVQQRTSCMRLRARSRAARSSRG